MDSNRMGVYNHYDLLEAMLADEIYEVQRTALNTCYQFNKAVHLIVCG